MNKYYKIQGHMINLGMDYSTYTEQPTMQEGPR